jgi:D-alanyl-D-alanine carboxypeptidase
MLRSEVLRCGAVALAALVVAAAASGDADARSRRHRAHRVVHQSYDPAYASIVVDANSGKVMQETSADSPRHPASLTKMMTLYLLFERLEAGKIRMSTQMGVSDHAADQQPSKLDLKPGQQIDVENAIKAVVTRSANDVAVVIAEALGGSEAEFARMMTAKARELGMMRTYYHNASGLPDERQITTARDQSILARALQDRFPRYFGYFSTRAFAYRGKVIRNHNHLLGRINGVNGIKTGYVRESGFNIVTSCVRGDRRVVAVVFGGKSAGWRDARVESLIEDAIDDAAVKRTAPMVVEGWQNGPKFVSAAPAPQPVPHPAPPVAAPDAQLGSTAPIKPNAVKTVPVMPGTVNAAMLAPPLPRLPKAEPAKTEPPKAEPPAAKQDTVASLSTIKREAPPAPPARSGAMVVHEVAPAAARVAALSEPAVKPRGPYMIQVGAFDDEGEAKQRLSAAQTKAKGELGAANPFTEKVEKSDKALYRARFAGLDKGQAEAACRNLKRSEIPCFMLKTEN